MNCFFYARHPGPLGFEIVADGFAQVYVKALRKVVNRTGSPNPYKLMNLITQHDLPKPVYCNPKWCGSQEPPSCVNFEKPTYGNAQIKIVTPETDDLIPYKTLYSEHTKTWDYDINGLSRLIPREDRSKKECQHLDFCAGYTSSSDSWITFRLPRMEKGQIFVCCTNGKKCGKELLDFDFVLDGHEIDHHTITEQFGKCVQILDGFHMNMADSSGHLYLAMKGKEKKIRISHIITL